MMDPYETLGVPKDADTQTIKKSYRKKAKEEELEKQIIIGRQALDMFDQYEITEPEESNPFQTQGIVMGTNQRMTFTNTRSI